MLGKLEVLSLNPSLEALAQAVGDRDFPRMKSKAHSLKGASGYIGASCLHYSCYHIQDQFMAGNFDRMLDYYPLLIECAIDFKIESRKILAAHNGVEPVIDDGVETCTVASGYRIVKHDNNFYCLREG